MKESQIMRRTLFGKSAEAGQVIVIFVVAIVAIIGMVGLVLDGGSAFSQRRDEQNVADLAAVAGATAYLNTTGPSSTKEAAAVGAAQAIASANGYTHEPTAGLTVDVLATSTTLAGTVRVDLTKPHRNNFAAVMGMPTWPVSVTATAVSSSNPNRATEALPILFNAEAFPGAICDITAPTPCSEEVYQMPGAGNEDVPQDGTQFNWTIFCQASGNACNGNSEGVRDLIEGAGADVSLDDDIGPLNAGAHTTLFNALELKVPGTFPVPIVDDDGNMVGFAYFMLTGVEGTSEKVIRGYFVSPVNAEGLTIDESGPGATLETGVNIIKLTN
ncbi:MAG: Tad domain-containing protein [Chloroflexi bacterium]|nr:Tad domain-containing protein [Chloroflexota bacterium]